MEVASHAPQILTSMITPAVLISACGTLLFSTSNRLGRAVDRVRVLSGEIERSSLPAGAGGTPLSAERREFILDQLPRLSRRIRYLQTAMTSFYAAVGFFVATSVALGIAAIAPESYGWIPVLLGLLGSCVLLNGSIRMVFEARHSVATTLNELRLVERQTRGGTLAENNFTAGRPPSP